MSLNYKVRTRAYGLRDSLPFGKYKGQLVYDLIDHDPSYLIWCISNVDNFSLTARVMELAKEAAAEGLNYFDLDCEYDAENYGDR